MGIQTHSMNTELPWLTFHSAKEAFALPIQQVKEIIQYGDITEIPLTPPYIRGVINLRGAVVPVLDLAVRFEKPLSIETKNTCIIIVEMKQQDIQLDVGLIVDSVSEVIDIPANCVSPPPRLGAHAHTDFIMGIANINQHFVFLLELGHILSLEELADVVEKEQMSNFI